MTILGEIKAIVGIDARGKGLSPNIITHVQRILSLIDEEMISIGYDFQNDLIYEEARLLDLSISGQELDEMTFKELGIMQVSQVTGLQEITLGISETGQALEDDDAYDDTAFLDEDDGN